jgi:hypothetical protein
MPPVAWSGGSDSDLEPQVHLAGHLAPRMPQLSMDGSCSTTKTSVGVTPSSPKLRTSAWYRRRLAWRERPANKVTSTRTKSSLLVGGSSKSSQARSTMRCIRSWSGMPRASTRAPCAASSSACFWAADRPRRISRRTNGMAGSCSVVATDAARITMVVAEDLTANPRLAIRATIPRSRSTRSSEKVVHNLPVAPCVGGWVG